MKSKLKTPLVKVPTTGKLSRKLLTRLAKEADDFIASRLGGKAGTPAVLVGVLEQIYTTASFAVFMRHFIEQYFNLDNYQVVDPCGGDGAIADVLPTDTIAMDVDPKSPTIIRANYLATTIVANKPIAVVANPPFRLAVRFFNHAATQAELIAIIVPCTFYRNSVLCQLDDNFHLKAEVDVPRWAFLRAGAPCDVPAILQIWERRPIKRVKPLIVTHHADFTFGSAAGADMGIQRIGANAGRTHYEFYRSHHGHLFIKASHPECASYVKAMINTIDMPGIAKKTSALPFVNRVEVFTMFSELERDIGY